MPKLERFVLFILLFYVKQNNANPVTVSVVSTINNTPTTQVPIYYSKPKPVMTATQMHKNSEKSIKRRRKQKREPKADYKTDGKDGEVIYISNFHRAGTGGYDHYEAFHTKDNGSYAHAKLNEIEDDEKNDKKLYENDAKQFSKIESEDEYEDGDEDDEEEKKTTKNSKARKLENDSLTKSKAKKLEKDHLKTSELEKAKPHMKDDKKLYKNEAKQFSETKSGNEYEDEDEDEDDEEEQKTTKDSKSQKLEKDHLSNSKGQKQEKDHLTKSKARKLENDELQTSEFDKAKSHMKDDFNESKAKIVLESPPVEVKSLQSDKINDKDVNKSLEESEEYEDEPDAKKSEKEIDNADVIDYEAIEAEVAAEVESEIAPEEEKESPEQPYAEYEGPHTYEVDVTPEMKKQIWITKTVMETTTENDNDANTDVEDEESPIQTQHEVPFTHNQEKDDEGEEVDNQDDDDDDEDDDDEEADAAKTNGSKKGSSGKQQALKKPFKGYEVHEEPDEGHYYEDEGDEVQTNIKDDVEDETEEDDVDEYTQNYEDGRDSSREKHSKPTVNIIRNKLGYETYILHDTNDPTSKKATQSFLKIQDLSDSNFDSGLRKSLSNYKSPGFNRMFYEKLVGRKKYDDLSDSEENLSGEGHILMKIPKKRRHRIRRKKYPSKKDSKNREKIEENISADASSEEKTNISECRIEESCDNSNDENNDNDNAENVQHKIVLSEKHSNQNENNSTQSIESTELPSSKELKDKNDKSYKKVLKKVIPDRRFTLQYTKSFIKKTDDISDESGMVEDDTEDDTRIKKTETTTIKSKSIA